MADDGRINAPATILAGLPSPLGRGGAPHLWREINAALLLETGVTARLLTICC
jgi:hypothetical protein